MTWSIKDEESYLPQNFGKLLPSKYYRELNLHHPDMEAKSFIYFLGQEYAVKIYSMVEAKPETLGENKSWCSKTGQILLEVITCRILIFWEQNILPKSLCLHKGLENCVFPLVQCWEWLKKENTWGTMFWYLITYFPQNGKNTV